MKKISSTVFCSTLLWLSVGFTPHTNKQNEKQVFIADTVLAQTAFSYLNSIRSNPSAYSREIGVNLQGVPPRHVLRWNDTLAQVARAKALDMAKRNYFGHVTPDGYGINYLIHKNGYTLHKDFLKDKRGNNFESIGAGLESAKILINTLIVDKGVRSLGHRKHLLGIDEWNASLKDIGIGYVKSKSSFYPSYACIIIAKHSW